MTILDEILADVRDEVAAAKRLRPMADLRARIPDAPPVRPLPEALEAGFGLIAEIKRRSPSVGPMRTENADRAPAAYNESPVVRAISVLTNATHFGMGINDLARIRGMVSRPVLRKDFLIDEYQVREARAFGADAVLLMANVLDAARLRGFYDLARELGMQALFEIHTADEIALLPHDAVLVGINSRKFKAQSGFVSRGESSEKDFSLDFSAFDLADRLPRETLRVAESGLTAATVAEVVGPFHAALVGTSLLRDERGIARALADFESALAPATT